MISDVIYHVPVGQFHVLFRKLFTWIYLYLIGFYFAVELYELIVLISPGPCQAVLLSYFSSYRYVFLV